MDSSSLDAAASVLAKSKYLVALTGAGISAESGVPTFRGRGGLWEKYKVEELATPQAFRRDPAKVWSWYKWRMEIISKARPNFAHVALAKLEEMGLLKALITQNVDGLHRRAGSKNVIELHGCIWRLRCTSCDYAEEVEEPVREVPPRCPRCRSLLRPGVVWFGEALPERELKRAYQEVSRADAMLVVGTSGVVMPAGMLPLLAKERGAVVVEVNVEESAITPYADYFLRGRATEVMKALFEGICERLGKSP